MTMNGSNRKISHSGTGKIHKNDWSSIFVGLGFFFFSKNTLFPNSGTLAKELNEEQRLAVKNIVEANNKPVPYLLFGPAGSVQFKSIFFHFFLIFDKINSDFSTESILL